MGEAALFAQDSLELYRSDWLKFLKHRTEVNVPISRSGLIQIALTDEYLQKHKGRYDSNCIPGYRPEYLSYSELIKKEPNLTIDASGAIFHPEPWIDLKTYIEAVDLSVHTFTNIDLRLNSYAVRVQSSGEFVTIALADGQLVQAQNLVIATGLASSGIGGLLDFPISWVRGDGVTIRTPDNKPIFRNNIYCDPGFIAPRNTGEMLLGSTYIDEGLKDLRVLERDRETISFGALDKIISANSQISRHLEECVIERQWHGWRPKSKDEYPILGSTDDEPRIIYALGFLGLGITMSVGVGNVIQQYVLDSRNEFPKSLLPDRFKN